MPGEKTVCTAHVRTFCRFIEIFGSASGILINKLEVNRENYSRDCGFVFQQKVAAVSKAEKMADL